MQFSPEMQSLLSSWLQGLTGVGRALAGDPDISWQEAREAYDRQLAVMLPAPPGVSFSETALGGIPALKVTPEAVEEGRTLFYIHGGGYVHGGVQGYRSIAGHYARMLNAVVYIPDYRQAPEYPFPVPVEDTFRAWRGLLELNPGRIAISGDSAGGSMLITIMRRARDAGLRLPDAAVALSPWADLSHSGESARSRNRLDSLSGDVDALNGLARLFLGRELATHPDVSPVCADMRGLPPVYILMGENEVMLSGGIALAERLADQRVRVRLDVWPGMFHVWPVFVGHMPEADEALDEAVRFILREFIRKKQADFAVESV